MLRRFSTKFGKSRKDDGDAVKETNGTTNGSSKSAATNGAYTNGTSNGASASGNPGLDKRQSSFGIQTKKAKKAATDHSASRGDVESTFAQFAQLIHASQRPLPTQSGDGAYLEHKEPSGLMSDMKALGFKDVHTLMDVMKNKATGALQDDKTYLMEKTIQVSSIQQMMLLCLTCSKLVAALPTNSKTRVDLTNAFVCQP